MEASTEYLVNKPLQAVVCRLIMFSRGREIAQKIIFGREGKLQRQIRNLRATSLGQGCYQPIYQQARPGFIQFIVLPLISYRVSTENFVFFIFCTFRAAFETSFVLPLIITITISSNVIGASAASFFINHSEQL